MNRIMKARTIFYYHLVLKTERNMEENPSEK